MEKNKIEKGIIDLRSLGMTGEEKNTMLTRIMGEEPRPLIHVSSWTTLVWRNFMVQQSWSTTVVASALILMLLGGSVAFAAETTLPGDTLYPLKIEVTEPIRDSIAFTASAKAYMEQLKIERRLHEAARLAAEGRLTEKLNEEIQDKIKQSAKKLVQLVAK